MPVFIPIKPAPEYSKKSVIYGEKQVRDILKNADVDMDNNLSWSELRKAVAKMGSRCPPYRAWCCLQKADANNDGLISPSEKEQLVRYLMKWYNAN